MQYLLFACIKDNEGGAADFVSAHDTATQATQAARVFWEENDPRLSSWMQLAIFDGKEMKLLAYLVIPGTEYYDEDDRSEPWTWKSVS